MNKKYVVYSTSLEEVKEIIKQATLRAEQKSNEIISTAKEEANILKDRASKDIAQEKEKVMNELKNDISSIAILAASKVIEEDIDQAKHEEMIKSFHDEVSMLETEASRMQEEFEREIVRKPLLYVKMVIKF